jgi:ferrochelatase
MRNWAPYLAEAITRLRERECRRAAGLILAPHRSQTSWERYQLDVEGARQEAGQGLEVLYPPAWHTNPLFIEAIADRIAEAAGIPEDRKKEREEERPAAHVVFTAHSIPAGMAADSNYAAEIRATSELVAARVGAANWSVAYQSASGDGRTPWLGPDIDEEIRGLRQRGVDSVILCPVGFLCDHVEVLYDLDVEARATAAELGIRFARAGTVGTHPQFIRLLAELVGAL